MVGAVSRVQFFVVAQAVMDGFESIMPCSKFKLDYQNTVPKQ